MVIDERIRTTAIFWIMTSLFSFILIGHSLEWFPENIFGSVRKYPESVSAIIIVSLIGLITLHTVSEEKFPVVCLYMAGFLLGIVFALGAVAVALAPPLVIAYNPLRHAGKTGCSARRLVSTSERFRTTGLLWVATILFSLPLMGDVQHWHWLPNNITYVASTYKRTLFVFVMMLLICLIRLHTVRKENYPMVSLFAAAFIAGLSLSFAWGIDMVALIVAIATIPILRAGLVKGSAHDTH